MPSIDDPHAAALAPTAALARFIADQNRRTLPAAVTEAAARAFTHWIGCALGAHGNASLDAVRR
ncbi:MAG: hypothetical protein H7125_06135, partial [Proteobacteria bacterium]|nr:hypothetical protein [Burkholderiales bacterium]